MEEEKVVKKKQKKVWPIVILMLIIGLAVGGVGSYYCFEVINKKDTTTENKNTTEKNKDVTENNKTEEISTDSPYINELVDQYDTYFVSNVELADTLYGKDKTNITDLSEDYLRALVIQKSNNGLGNNLYVTGDSFQNNVKILFGTQIQLINKDFSIHKGCTSYQYYNGSYSIKPSEGGCGGTSAAYLQRKVIKAVKSADTLEITIAYAIINEVTNTVSTDSQAANKIEGLTADSVDIIRDKEKLPQFKYVYTYDKTNLGYYLNYIQKVK